MNRKPICILVAGAFAASAACAQTSDFVVSGTVGFGGIHSDEDKDSTKDLSYLNKYMDLSSGFLSLIDVKGRGSRYWFDLFGENLGRDDQFIEVRGGLRDVFKYRLYTDALRHNYLFNGRTPYAGAGSDAPRAVFPRLDPNTWNGLDMSARRRDDGGMFEWQGASALYMRVDANQVKWQGTKPGSSSQGLSPGNGFVDLALPVDYVTRNVLVEAGYNTRQMHFDVSWMSSRFDNDNESISWQNGYFGNGIDRTHLAADNDYTRIAANASFRQLPWNTTLAARFTTDKMDSDIPLADSVLGTTTGGMQATGASTGTFNGRVENETFTVTANSAPMRGLDLRAYYNYRQRDDRSTQVSFNSSAIPGPFVNEPYSYETNNWGFDAYWRINRANRVGGGYDYNDTDREGRFDFDNTKDKKYFLEWRNSSLDSVGLRLKYQRLERDSNFLLSNSGTSPTDADYWNRYWSAYDLANVDQDYWKLTLDWTPLANLDFGFEGIIKENQYRDSTLGRLKDDRREVYVNVSYLIPDKARFTLFGDAEEVKYDSTHRIVGSGTTAGAYEPATPPNASNYNWNGQVKDRNWAVGAAVDVPVGDRLTIKASAIYYKTDGTVDLALQDGVPASVTRPIPIGDWDDSTRTSFTIKAIALLTKSVSLTAGYAYERYTRKDAQYDGYRFTIPASSRQDSYLDGVYAQPQFRTNFIYGLVSYRF